MNRTSIVAAALVLTVAGALPAAAQSAAGPQVVVLETTQGKIVIQLEEKKAPKTSANFKKLVRQGFYDGTYFHRVIANFMIQGGDPNTKNANPADDGQGGPGYTIPAELGLPHVRGAVATARLGDNVNPAKASSGSQFFIDLAALRSLDQGGYTVFGRVIAGMDAVDRIARFASDSSLPQAAAGGRNPGRRARITRAYLEPLARHQAPPAAAPAPGSGPAPTATMPPQPVGTSTPAPVDTAPAPPDTTRR